MTVTPALAGLLAMASFAVALLAIPLLLDKGPVDRLQALERAESGPRPPWYRRLVDWLGPKPYLTVTAAVGVTLVVRVFLMLLASDALEELGMGGGAVFVVVLVTHALILVAALAGLWRARRKVGAGAATVPREAPAPVVHTFSWPVETRVSHPASAAQNSTSRGRRTGSDARPW